MNKPIARAPALVCSPYQQTVGDLSITIEKKCDEIRRRMEKEINKFDTKSLFLKAVKGIENQFKKKVNELAKSFDMGKDPGLEDLDEPAVSIQYDYLPRGHRSPDAIARECMPEKMEECLLSLLATGKIKMKEVDMILQTRYVHFLDQLYELFEDRPVIRVCVIATKALDEIVVTPFNTIRDVFEECGYPNELTCYHLISIDCRALTEPDFDKPLASLGFTGGKIFVYLYPRRMEQPT